MTTEEPDSPVEIAYGFDRVLGFFCSVRLGRSARFDYDSTAAGYDGLPGLLAGLVRIGCFERDDVGEALRLLPIVDALDDIEDRTVRLVAKLIVDLRMAAAD